MEHKQIESPPTELPAMATAPRYSLFCRDCALFSQSIHVKNTAAHPRRDTTRFNDSADFARARPQDRCGSAQNLNRLLCSPYEVSNRPHDSGCFFRMAHRHRPGLDGMCCAASTAEDER